MSRSGSETGTLQRLVEMIHLLGGGRAWSVAELSSRFEVSERTIFRDLVRLQSAQVGIEKGESGYRLSGRLPEAVTLSAAERALLSVALSQPALHLEGAPAERTEALKRKLGVSASGLKEPAAWLAGPERTGPVGSRIVETLEEAIARERVVAVGYTSLSSGARVRPIEPWAFVHRDGIWYVPAWCHENEALRFFRLDRIDSARLTDRAFRHPADPARIREELERSWSIFRAEALREIVVHFEARLAPLIERGRHHENEAIERLPDGSIEYRIVLSHLDEIARWIVGFGGEARVVAPEDLRHRVEQIAAGALAMHGNRRKAKRAPADRREIAGKKRVEAV